MHLRLVPIPKSAFKHNEKSKIKQDIVKRKTTDFGFNDIKIELRVHLK